LNFSINVTRFRQTFIFKLLFFSAKNEPELGGKKKYLSDIIIERVLSIRAMKREKNEKQFCDNICHKHELILSATMWRLG